MKSLQIKSFIRINKRKNYLYTENEALNSKNLLCFFLNPLTRHPEHICNHCGGDPQCVKHCPYGTLSFKEIDINNTYFGLSPEEIAEKLYERFYSGEEVIYG